MRRSIDSSGTLLALTLTAVFVSSIVADSDASAAPKRLKDIVQLGAHWYGPELSHRDLRGRVVLVKVWGLN